MKAFVEGKARRFYIQEQGEGLGPFGVLPQVKGAGLRRKEKYEKSKQK
jgi:hypothetical protein